MKFTTLAGNTELPAIMICLVEATLLGTFAGWIRVRWDVPGLIVTIALMLSLRGVAFVLTNAYPIPITNDGFAFLGSGYILGVPFPAIVFLATMALFGFITTRTVYGRSVYAVGGNAEATRLSGIPVNRVRITIFATTGLLAAMSGVLLTARLNSGYAGVGVGWEFDCIAAVIIGGTSLFGGEGSMFGTLLGVLFIGLLGNGMVLLGVNPYMQDVARGVIITICCQYGLIRSRSMPLLITPMISAPTTHSGIDPIPPERLVPPMTVAAMASSSYPSP